MKHAPITELKNFINFSLQRLLPNPSLINDDGLMVRVFEETVLDFRYHLPKISKEDIKNDILRNRGGLPVFLYRLASTMHKLGHEEDSKYQIHFLMKVLCGCEIFWTSQIDEGFIVMHGMGTVIGPRIKIGRGFRIYQGCTVGQKDLKSALSPKIGNDVTLFSNSQILGDVTIGNSVIIGANSLVIDNIKSGKVVAGNPAKEIKGANGG